jgi:hypothetical protein
MRPNVHGFSIPMATNYTMIGRFARRAAASVLTIF